MEQTAPKIFTENPFSYNYVAKQQSKVNDLPIPGKDDVVASPDANAIGKALGLVSNVDWRQNYDKIFLITEWAKERSGLRDPEDLIRWIKEASKQVFSLGQKRLDSLYMNIKLMGQDKYDVS